MHGRRCTAHCELLVCPFYFLLEYYNTSTAIKDCYLVEFCIVSVYFC